ncbi:MAG: hypothetical protein AAF939_19830, partial [Planctomycetota bacterium]
MKLSVIGLLFLAICENCVAQENKTPAKLQQDIEQFLKIQQQAWNQGDLEKFMESYWKSPDLTFSSGGKTT